jgi:hypothetical protein
VRGVSCEAAELIEGRFEAGKGVVDHRRQPSDFVVGILDRQALVESIGGNPPGLRSQVVDRHKRPAGEKIPAHAGKQSDQRQSEQQYRQNLSELAAQPLF